MAKTLTAAAVKNYRPGKGRREIPDGGCPGLYLVIQASGHRSWAMRFRRPNGKPAKLTLGPVDLSGKEAESEPVLDSPLTLASARRLAAEIHRQRAMGRDVVADYDASRRRQKSEHESRAKSTFAAAARDFIEQYASKKTRRWRETARLLGLAYPPTGGEPTPIKGGLCERWSDKPIAEIDGHDIHSLIDETRRSGAPGLERRSDGPTEARARVMLSCLSKMFGWLVQHRRVSQNPCKDVHRPEASRARDRVLTDAEIVKFWRATDAERKEFSALLKLLLLTGCRLNEVAGMTRAELSDDGATWNIPGARTKNKRPHVVPLAPLARKMVGKRKRGICLHDHRSIAGQRLVQDKATPRRSNEDSAVAAARPAPHGRDRHGRDRHRPAHRRSGAESHQRSQGGVAGTYTTARPTRQRSVRRWNGGHHTWRGSSPGGRRMS